EPVDERGEPDSRRGARVDGVADVEEVREALAQHPLEERLLAAEVEVGEPLRDAGGGGDVVHGCRMKALLGEGSDRPVEDAAAGGLATAAVLGCGSWHLLDHFIDCPVSQRPRECGGMPDAYPYN